MVVMDGETKAKAVSNALTALISQGEYSPGEKIPSFRKLAQRYNISPLTASAAVNNLRASGMVEIKAGVGAFVAKRDSPSAKDRLTIGLACPGFAKSYIEEPGTTHPALVQFMTGLRDHFDGRSATVRPIVYSSGHIGDEGSQIRHAIDAREIKGLAIDGTIAPCDAEWLNKTGIPFVLLESDAGGQFQAAYVKVNVTFGFRLLLRHLRALGHSDILVVTYRTDSIASHLAAYVAEARREGFDRFSADHVIMIEDRDRSISEVDYDPFVKDALDRRPDAIVARDEVISNRILWEAMRLGIDVPNDLSLASTVDMAPHTHPIKLTTLNVATMLRECADLAGELLERGIRGENIRGEHVIVTPTLVPGETTKAKDNEHKT